MLWVLCAVALLLAVCRLAENFGQRSADTSAQTEVVAETQSADMQLAPDIVVYDGQGNPCRLSDFRGKPVVLNFWASWCGPCKSEMPDFEEKYLEYGDRIHFLMVNLTDGMQETVEAASAFIAEMGYTFPVYFDTDLNGANTYGISAIPLTIFIDRDGALLGGQQGMIGADVLQQAIDVLLAG